MVMAVASKVAAGGRKGEVYIMHSTVTGDPRFLNVSSPKFKILHGGPSLSPLRTHIITKTICQGQSLSSYLFYRYLSGFTLFTHVLQITGTIASVRKRREIDTGVLYNSDERGEVDNNDNDNHDREDGEDDDDPNDNSFVAEESFIRAPLNPRIPDNVKPHKNMHFSKSKRDKNVAETPSPDGCLNTLSTEIQEALILEELLNALMVTYHGILSHRFILKQATQGIPGVHITCDLPLPDEVGSPRDVKFTVTRLLGRQALSSARPKLTYLFDSCAFPRPFPSRYRRAYIASCDVVYNYQSVYTTAQQP